MATETPLDPSPTDGITSVVFAPTSNLLAVSSWDKVSGVVVVMVVVGANDDQ